MLRSDADNVPIYLEAAEESDVPLYKCFGFEVIEEWDIPNGGLHF